jgi:hypothetical protein
MIPLFLSDVSAERLLSSNIADMVCPVSKFGALDYFNHVPSQEAEAQKNMLLIILKTHHI